MTYGGTAPTITPGYSGFVNSDSAASLTTQPTCSTTATSSSPVLGSPYVSSCGGAVDHQLHHHLCRGFGDGHSGQPDRHRLQRLHALRRQRTHRLRQLHRASRTATRASSLSFQPTCSTTATSSSTVAGSPYLTSCSGAADANYSITYATGQVSVGSAPLTITASSGSMTYGGIAPTITPNYSGFVNGDTATSLTVPPTCTTAATSSSSVAGSPYTSSCSGAADPNYTISYTASSVSVGKAPLTITASSPTTTYGTVATVTPVYGGLRQRRHGVVAHDAAHLLDHADGVESRWRVPSMRLRAAVRWTATTPSPTRGVR